MITVKTESKLASGQVRRRYEVTVSDLEGNEHKEVLGMFNHDINNDGSSVEEGFLNSKKEQETEQYKTAVREGENPFFTVQAFWNTRSELLKAILVDALSLPATGAIVYNGLPFLSHVTDIELITLFDKNQAWVDDVREKASVLLAAKNNLDSYQAVL